MFFEIPLSYKKHHTSNCLRFYQQQFTIQTWHEFRLTNVQKVYKRKYHLSDVSVDGVTVSIGAFQALVPGSTPGRRIFVTTYKRV